MISWDEAAQERLADIVAIVRAEGVAGMFERIIARVWKVNVDRFEPSEIGDTNRSLGITSAENIRTLVLREAWAAGNPAGLGAGVHVTAPNDSLLVQVAGVRLHVMKSAPSISLSEPRWDAAGWNGESEVRLAAASANAECLSGHWAVPGGLFEDDLPAAGTAARLSEVMLVWAGGSNSPFTGGWIGLPVVGDRPWLAVRNLWWHGSGGVVPGSRDGDTRAGDTFSARDVPSPVISLKRRQRTAGL